MSHRNEWAGVLRGVLLLFVLHVVAILIIWLIGAVANATFGSSLVAIRTLNSVLLSAIAAIGITQLIYVIPLAVMLNRGHHYSVLKGVIIGAVLTALLNSGCFLWLWTQVR